MIRTYVLPLIALAGIVFAILTVRASSKQAPPAQPVAEPADAPFVAYISGAGLVEASTENIAIAPIVAGVVTELYVKVGTEVKAGDPLFKVDDRNLQASLLVSKAALESAKQKLLKLENQPRPEDVPPAEAKVAEARASLEDATTQYQLMKSLEDARAVSQDELNRRKYAVDVAKAKLDEMAASLAQLKAGTWKPDLDIARAEVTSAEAEVKSVQIDIDRLLVRAPVDGRLLQVKIRLGEFAQTGVLATPLMLLGDVKTMHVRVDIDENDAWRLKPGNKARASVRGNRDLATDVEFVRVEPYVVPKRSLTGESTERVDTRVLQVLFKFEATKLPVYVGQQMDVFIEADPIGQKASATTTASGK